MEAKTLNFIFDYPFSYSRSMKENDKVNYIAALLKISDVDGITRDEEMIIGKVLNFFFLNDDVLEKAKMIYKSKTFDELMPSSEIKALFFPYLLRDAVAVAYIHGGISKTEDEKLKKIATEMGYHADHYEHENIEESYFQQIKAATVDCIDSFLRLNRLINR